MMTILLESFSSFEGGALVISKFSDRLRIAATQVLADFSIRISKISRCPKKISEISLSRIRYKTRRVL